MGYVKVLVIKMLLPNNRIVEMNDIVDEKLIPDVERLKKDGYVAKATKAELDAFNDKEKSDYQKEEESGKLGKKSDDLKTDIEKDSKK